jgi:hypothetical protein
MEEKKMKRLEEFKKNQEAYSKLLWEKELVSLKEKQAYKKRQDDLLKEMTEDELIELIEQTSNKQAKIYLGGRQIRG